MMRKPAESVARQLREYEKTDAHHRARERRESSRKRELDRQLKRRAAALEKERRDADLRAVLLAQSKAMGISVQELIQMLKKGDAPEAMQYGSFPADARGVVVIKSGGRWIRQRTGFWSWLAEEASEPADQGIAGL